MFVKYITQNKLIPHYVLKKGYYTAQSEQNLH